MQSLQRWPPPPHARTSDPVRHWPLVSQHPFGQVAAVQLPGVVPESPPSGGGSISRLERPQPEPTKTKTSAAKKATPKKRASEGRRMGRCLSRAA